ncbi:MAG: 1,4-dihydroxy-2-naphthoate polyprenyltransferase [Proteobacteria bacterium]|jgi:1,4-dihydroxy-2-naphthoate octaprenyltransferase|nr:1,4-dihydroxy-2-naphthoate polyprenyltransferase [Pseudomonadota bacterium]
MMKRIKMWILAFRPRTLTAALVPILGASALTFSQTGSWVWQWSLLALLASFLIQIGTNLVNDAVDFMKGADTSERLGPQRVTQSGVFTTKEVLFMATVLFALAILCGVPLVLEGGWPIFVVGLISVALGYGYTAGPYPLAYKGLGDLFVILFFGIVAVVGLFFIQTKLVTWEAVVLGLQIGLHATVLIAINNLRDMEGDRKVNKMTLAARFGLKFGRYEIAVLSLSPFLLGIFWGFRSEFWAFLLPWAALPLGVKIVKLVFITEPGREYNRFLGMAAGLHLIFGILLSVGLVL